MAQEARRNGRSRVAWITAVLLVVLSACLFLFGSYLRAAGWHCLHGNYADLAGHRVRVPLLWRKEGADDFTAGGLIRACPGWLPLTGEVVARPLRPGLVRSTDQEERKAVQHVIDELNQRSPSGMSLVELDARAFSLTCLRDNIGLHCYAAKVPYSFDYMGWSTHEAEAEAILKSLD